MDDSTHEDLSSGSANTVRVRQGITGQGVRYVLAFSLVGAIIALGVVVMIFYW